ncbi:deoxyuridine 5'-triphosphate nucleotidohydrolase [Candidatus Bathyarchaeota archaeon]|nr:deoxyuridine 5'-triphosphate nucleotidohydrolase [Candidatus Bathyarchaeota archaeon]
MLNDKILRKLITEQSLVTGYIDLDMQLQPSGFDLSLEGVEAYLGGGAVDFSNEERIIAETEKIMPDRDGWISLGKGVYKVIYNEVVKMPLNVAAIARTRSTLLRNGAEVGTAVWDPGYEGRSSSMLTVHNPHGLRLKKDARVAQLIFFETGDVEKGYSGVYQKERM